MRDLYNYLQSLGVIADDGPKLLSPFLSCGKNFAILEDLPFDRTRKERLFFALLDARIVLATLRSCCVLKKLSYPDQLSKLTITPSVDDFPGLPSECNGKDFFDWAFELEREICRAVDSFSQRLPKFFENFRYLASLSLISMRSIKFNGRPIAERGLILLDDVNDLAPPQRNSLLEVIVRKRPETGVWVGIRLEALSPEEILTGAISGRDHDLINLEDFWRKKKSQNELLHVADRRAKAARDAEFGSFSECLEEDSSPQSGDTKEISEKIRTRINQRVSDCSDKYTEWFASLDQGALSGQEKAIRLRELEILIERDLLRPQLDFDFGEPLSISELKERESSGTRNAAIFFLHREFKLPYYYGLKSIATLASNNVEQFLGFGEALFEESLGAAILKKQKSLSVRRQEAILKGVAKSRWNEIPRRSGREVQQFLESLADLCVKETVRPNAPYAPGVTGIAITMQERKEILLASSDNTAFCKLRLILSRCLAHNYLEVNLNAKQGGNDWMVMYLNRWLCLRFDLPLYLGGWRPRSLKDLLGWTNAQKEEGARLF